MDAIKAWIPSTEAGYLPLYIFSLSVIAVGNSLQNYLTLHYTRRMYNGQFTANPALPARSSTFEPEDSTNKLVFVEGNSNKKTDAPTSDQVTPLAARLFGTYTFISAVVRIYGAYNLHNEAMYQLCLWTYVVALGHFASEFAYFRSALMGTPVLMPFFFATVGISWMAAQYGHYVQS